MRMFSRIAVLAAAAGIMVQPAFGQQRDPAGRGDYHYRLSPHAYPQYRYYPAPRTYYPRRPQDRPKLQPAPQSNMRDPRSPLAPQYGAPPAAIDRIPRT